MKADSFRSARVGGTGYGTVGKTKLYRAKED
jgi:hypothetical protein